MNNLYTSQHHVLMTAITSIAHNGESIGIDQPFHREKMMMPDGRIHEIPTITGNSFRGILRDVMANLVCAVLEIDILPSPQFYLLYSGGSLTKDGGKWFENTSVKELRELLPHLSLFGFSVGNKIPSGKWRCGKFIPLAKETVHLTPKDMQGLGNRSFYDMMQIEAYTRTDDDKRETRAVLLKQGKDHAPDDLAKEVSQQMRFQIETICAGTQFWWSYSFNMASELERTALYCAFGKWAEDPRLGGVSRWGHGMVEFDFGGGVVLNSTNNPFADAVETYSQYLRDNRQRITGVLTYGL